MSGMHINGFFSGKAQHVFSRNIKRVCFDVNPFHERTVKDDGDDAYLPTSKFVPHLSSIVLIENPWDLSSPQYEEMNAENFWNYLYSNTWGDICTLRVLEGELLELLLHCIYILERDYMVISCTHSAFVNNRRFVPPFMKTNKKEDEEFIDEILLIDLTYYFKRIESNEYEFSSRIDNLYSHLPEKYTKRSQCLSPLNHRGFPLAAMQKHRQNGTYLDVSEKHLSKLQAFSFSNQSTNPVRSRIYHSNQRHLSLVSSNIVNPIHMDTDHTFTRSTLPPLTERILISAEKKQKVLKKKGRKTESRKSPSSSSLSSSSSDSDTENYHMIETTPNRLLLSYNPKILKYLLQTSKSQDQFEYKQNIITKAFLGKSKKILQHKMMQLILEREQKEREYKAYKERMIKYDPSSPKVTELEHSTPSISVIKIFSKTPSFLDFALWLDEDGTWDPKYKKKTKKRLNRRMSEYIAPYPKPDITSSSTSVESEDPSKGSPCLTITENNKRKTYLPMVSSKVSQRKLSMLKSAVVKGSDSLATLDRITESISGENSFQLKGLSSDTFGSKGAEQKESLIKTESTKCAIKSKSKDTPGTNYSSVTDNSKVKKDGLLKPCINKMNTNKPSECKHDPHRRRRSSVNSKHIHIRHVPVTIDSVKSEEWPEELFNIKKINKSFSFDNFKEKTKLTTATFKNTVNRYMAIKKAVHAFKANLKSKSAKPTQTSAAISTQDKQQPKNVKEMKDCSILEDRQEKILGTMKPFKFLEYRNYIPKYPSVALPQFTGTALEDCFTKLQQAFDDFVIRKENITTDCGFKHLTSITFTRPAVFKKIG